MTIAPPEWPPPDFTTPDPYRAWWVEMFPQRPIRFVATSGWNVLRNMQMVLRLASYSTQKAYRRGGPLDAWNTDFGTVQVDSRWGPVTNAALWRLIADDVTAGNTGWIVSESTFASLPPQVLATLDAIERFAKDRIVNDYVIIAALWAAFYSRGPWRFPFAQMFSGEGARLLVRANATFFSWNSVVERPSSPTAATGMTYFYNPPPWEVPPTTQAPTPTPTAGGPGGTTATTGGTTPGTRPNTPTAPKSRSTAILIASSVALFAGAITLSYGMTASQQADRARLRAGEKEREGSK